MFMGLPGVLLRCLRVLVRLLRKLMRAQVVALPVGRRCGGMGMGGKIVVLSGAVVRRLRHRVSLLSP